MSKSHSIIEPFPAHIDRNTFGQWLSGFTDGEGSFVLGMYGPARGYIHYHAIAYYHIRLRNDDLKVLKLIQSFWKCGRLYEDGQRRCNMPNAKPSAIYNIRNVSELVSTVIPHFERYPLFAKKSNDFVTWKRAVELMALVQARKVRGRRRTGAMHFTGTINKWSESERQEFTQLSADLKARRQYPASDEPATPRPEAQPPEEQNMLF